MNILKTTNSPTQRLTNRRLASLPVRPTVVVMSGSGHSGVCWVCSVLSLTAYSQCIQCRSERKRLMQQFATVSNPLARQLFLNEQKTLIYERCHSKNKSKWSNFTEIYSGIIWFFFSQGLDQLIMHCNTKNKRKRNANAFWIFSVSVDALTCGLQCEWLSLSCSQESFNICRSEHLVELFLPVTYPEYDVFYLTSAATVVFLLRVHKKKKKGSLSTQLLIVEWKNYSFIKRRSKWRALPTLLVDRWSLRKAL